MKQMLISIPLSRLCSEVSRTTAYLGAKQAPADDPGRHYDRIAVIDEDRSLLARFASEAVSAFTERLKGMVSNSVPSSDFTSASKSVSSSGSDSDISLILTLSDSFDDRLSASVSDNFEAYMAAFITARWLRLVQPDKEAVWLTESQRLLNEIVSVVYYRNPPKRRK